MRAALSGFDVEWIGDPGAAPASRLGDHGDDDGILRHAAGVPAAIVEAGFVSNPAEARFFSRPDVQELEGRAIAAAIRAYLADDGRTARGVEPSTRPAPGEVPDDAAGCVDPPLE